MREARAAFDRTPTAQAIEQFEACLHGPFARDPDIRFGAAHMELRQCNERFGSPEAKVEYTLWAQAHGHIDTASSLRDEVTRTVRHMHKHARSINQPLLDRLNVTARLDRAERPHGSGAGRKAHGRGCRA